MRRFEYREAGSVEEAVAMLGQYGAEASLLAGGTDLFVEMREDLRHPRILINLKTAQGLDHLSYDDDRGLRIGSLVTTRALETSQVVKQHYPGLWQSVRELGSIQVRNRATLAGNVCRASPSADTLPPLIADRATIKIVGPSGEREIPLEDFFTGPGETVRSVDEVVTEINLPPPPPGSGKAYIKHGRRKAMELATVGVAAALVLENGLCRDICIALGAVAPTPIRARRAEAVLNGQAIDDHLIGEAAEQATRESKPISNVRSSADYRRKMVRVLTRRAIGLALGDAA